MKQSGARGKMAEAADFLVSHAMPGKAHSKVVAYYRLFESLFETLSEDSGILSIGYAENPGSADLAEAQRGLVRLTAQSLPKTGRWLDVGCGIGGPACLLATENPDVTITGINITPAHVEKANLRKTRQGLSKRVGFRHGDACKIPLPDKNFDGLYAIETAFHYPDKAAFAMEAHRVLKPGGAFSVADIVLDGKRFFPVRRFSRLLARPMMAAPEMYSPEDWRKSLKRAGFEGIEIRDISRETFGMLKHWRRRIGAHRKTLIKDYPGFMLTGIDIFFRFAQMTLGVNPYLYILVTAKKPA